MKIAIVTLPLHTNYGGILQCYALQTVLQRMGHEVVVLAKPKYGRSYPFIKMLAICKRILKRYVLGKKVNILLAPHEIPGQYIDKFIRRYIHHCYKRRWIPDTMRGFDAFVVGSDQIWRPEYSFPIENAFLDFTEGMTVKRIAYAASFGVEQCTYTEEQLSLCTALLQKFDTVSVREDSGIILCRKYFGVKAEQMLDPTLLLDVEDYRTLISSEKTTSVKGNMLVYVLDETEEKKRLVEQIAKERGLIPCWLSNDTNELQDAAIKIPVEQWLRAFDEAAFVFTDSFHGCVFSILFRKPFIVIGNKERGMSRFTSLLNLFALNERMVFSFQDYESRKQCLKVDIDYVPVYEKLEQERNRAFGFIKNCLA